MRKVTVVVPYLVPGPGCESALRPLPGSLQRIVEGARVVRLRPLPPSETPEAAFLGLDPREFQVSQGPLTVAALGHSPPQGSVHFHLSICSVDDGGELQAIRRIESGASSIREEEVRRVFESAESLRTRTLVPLRGEELDHALVWEDGSLELSTTPAREAFGQKYLACVPKGEGERDLRRFIDDSVNLLSSLELNRARTGEGLQPLNCLWPWGPGFRPDLPNLPLRRGDVARIESGSMRMQGLARLVGYQHGDRHAFVRGLRTDFARLLECPGRLVLGVVGSVEEMQRHHRPDEIAHNLEVIAKSVFEPLLAASASGPFELRLVAPGGAASLEPAPEGASEVGLALTYQSAHEGSNSVPFDERSLDDPRVQVLDAWEAVAAGLAGES